MFENATKYQQQRQAVIDLFSRYKIIRSDDGKDDGKDLDHLTTQVEILKENKYLLAIVGESKSGKSMFINALLRKPILPTGMLQCTSGIIEIIDTDNESDKCNAYLKVRYANEKTLRLEHESSTNINIEQVQRRLQEIASIQKEYRGLPTLQLNEYLIDNYTKQLTDDDLQGLFQKLENPHELPEQQFKSLIRRYLEEHKDLTKIPTEIHVGYPLKFGFTEMRIVDTPGINARGGLEGATVGFIVKANAAILIHTVNNIAAKPLKDFFDKYIPEQAKESIFMFLTRKALLKKEDVEETIEEAQKLFPKIVPKRIVAVDSMLKQIYDELEAGKALKEFKTDKEKWVLLASYILDFDYDVEKIKIAILQDSNFNYIENMLNEFSNKARNLQLKWIITEIENGYKEQNKSYVENIHLNRDKITKQPEEFENEIAEITNLLETYQKLLLDFSQSQKDAYKGVHSKVEVEFLELNEKYAKLLNDVQDAYQVVKYIIDFGDDCDHKLSMYIEKLNQEYTNGMEKVGMQFKLTGNIDPPQINMKSISRKAKITAYIEIVDGAVLNTIGQAISGTLIGTVVGGPIGALIGAISGSFTGLGTSKLMETSKVAEDKWRKFDKIYTIKLRNDVIRAVKYHSEKLILAISKLFESYDKIFKEELSKIIKERQETYDTLKAKKKDEDKIRKIIEELEKKQSDIKKEGSLGFRMVSSPL